MTKETINPNSPFALFQTNPDMEVEGITIDYGPFWFKVARAGGNNKKFAKVLAAKMKPYRRLIQDDRLPDEKARELLYAAVAEAVILSWGSLEHGEGFMIGRKGESIPFSIVNVVALFVDLPDLFQDLYAQAGKVALFREEDEQADAGN